MNKRVYGLSQTQRCPFCNAQAFTTNSQKIPVCKDHKNKDMPDMKCLCGNYLDLKKGKYGMFYTCDNCGTISMSKAQEMNSK